jgi:hypothetical protein
MSYKRRYRAMQRRVTASGTAGPSSRGREAWPTLRGFHAMRTAAAVLPWAVTLLLVLSTAHGTGGISENVRQDVMFTGMVPLPAACQPGSPRRLADRRFGQQKFIDLPPQCNLSQLKLWTRDGAFNEVSLPLPSCPTTRLYKGGEYRRHACSFGCDGLISGSETFLEYKTDYFGAGAMGCRAELLDAILGNVGLLARTKHGIKCSEGRFAARRGTLQAATEFMSGCARV